MINYPIYVRENWKDKFFETDKKILMCVSISTNKYEINKPYFQYQMGIHRSIGYIRHRYPDSRTTSSGNKFYDESISDNGKGEGYGVISLKLHSFTASALDEIDKLKPWGGVNRLVITHPWGDMTTILINSGLVAGEEFYMDDMTSESEFKTINGIVTLPEKIIRDFSYNDEPFDINGGCLNDSSAAFLSTNRVLSPLISK